jgi:1-acyl-sn-glycerol-3-phosphate acyltransferase
MGVRATTRGAISAEPALLVANHVGWLDIVAVLAQHDCAFIAKREVRTWPIVGPLAVRLGVIFVDRTRKRDLLTSIPALRDALRQGRRVLLFAEGTTGDGRALLPFKSALVEGAVQAGVPVVPIAIRAHAAEGDLRALSWIGDDTLLASLPRVRALRGAGITVHAGAAIAPGPTRKLLTAAAREAIARRLPDGAIVRRPADADDIGRASGGARFAWSWGLGWVRAVARPIAALLIGVLILYTLVPHYSFSMPSRFDGPRWYNPYAASERPTPPRWWRMNLHAHSRAWGGLTNGAESPERVVRRYRELGTDIVGVSNYQSLDAARQPGVFPVYEHGWNLHKAHHLVLGASQVEWLDLPFGGGNDAQQYLIDRLHTGGTLVALVHPALRGARSPEALQHLGGYELLEVLNHFLPPADSLWDAVLSVGHPVWLIAGDDSHNTRLEGETGTNYTQVLAADTSVRAVLGALARGAAVGVRVTDTFPVPQLRSLTVTDSLLTVTLAGPLQQLRLVSDSGRVLQARAVATTDGAAHQFTFALPATASYARLVAEGPGGLLYLNPVVRWNGRELPRATATIDGPGTARKRAVWALALAWGLLVVTMWQAPAPAPRRVPRRVRRRPSVARA